MIEERLFRTRADYLAYRNDVCAWGEETADEMWLQDYEALRSDVIAAKDMSMRRWNELQVVEQEELIVQEVRILINQIISDDEEDQEYLSTWLLNMFNRFVQAKRSNDEQAYRELRKSLIRELKNEVAWSLQIRNFPERYVGSDKSEQKEAANPKTQEIESSYYQYCDRCHDRIIGSSETLREHQEKNCPMLPRNRARELAKSLAGVA